MKSRLKFNILTCLLLAFSPCDSLHHKEEVRNRQSLSGRSFQFNIEKRQFQRLQDLLSICSNQQNAFPPHFLKVEHLDIDDLWQNTLEAEGEITAILLRKNKADLIIKIAATTDVTENSFPGIII